jgi:serine-type D-Ala-D-Ala carboxypeptidase (penicillin-binding protein 5/6)
LATLAAVVPQRLGAALTGLLLAATTHLAGPAPAGGAPTPTPTPTNTTGPTVAPPTTTPAFVPCPMVRVKPNPPIPTPSPMPPHDRGRPVVGGAGLATTGLTIPPGAPPLPKVLSAKYWVVADLDTGEVLGACGPHEYGAPASLQKLLLAAAVLPRLNPKQVITVTADDLNFEPGSSAVGLLRGGKYTVELLWLGLLLNSGNDAANVLARLGGGAGGQPAGVAAMNEQAEWLGAFDTHAETPSGLDGPGQVTSAYDLALIARACFTRADFRRYAATRRAQVPPQPPKDKHGFQIQNDNRLLLEYPGALGGKTGFTDIARHTFVGAAQRGGRRLVVTLLGAEHRPVRTWKQAAALLDWGFAVARGLSVGRLVTPGEVSRPDPTPSVPTTVAVRAAAGGPAPDRPHVAAGVVAVAALAAAWLITLMLLRRRRMRASAGGD